MKFCALLLLLAAAYAAPFNHKRHAPLKLECLYCHATAEKGVHAGMPAAGRCQLCHKSMAQPPAAIQRILKLRADAKPFQAEYDNLPDYVIFSHARHAQAKVACDTCHGKVHERDEPEPALALNMKACVDCHKSHGAKIVCTLCHELGQ